VTPKPLDARSERLLRELAPQALRTVIRCFRDFTAAEDAVQVALLAAAIEWPHNGLPDNPRDWLIQAATRRILDHVRQRSSPLSARIRGCGAAGQPRDCRGGARYPYPAAYVLPARIAENWI
jgi:DNA-directed RNA polymerase specialized sigma24 family protein